MLYMLASSAVCWLVDAERFPRLIPNAGPPVVVVVAAPGAAEVVVVVVVAAPGAAGVVVAEGAVVEEGGPASVVVEGDGMTVVVPSVCTKMYPRVGGLMMMPRTVLPPPPRDP
jgi:hypothetical protein